MTSRSEPTSRSPRPGSDGAGTIGAARAGRRPRRDRRHRLRLAVQPADRPARARAPRVLRADPARCARGARAGARTRRASSCRVGRRACTRPDAPLVPRYVLDSGKPILGICYGMQLLAHQLGGEVEPGTKREYGPAVVRVGDPPARDLSRLAARVFGVDEPRRRRAAPAARLLRCGHQRQLARRGDVERRWADRHPVSPRGRPHQLRLAAARQFSARRVRLHGQLDDRDRSSIRRSTTCAAQVGQGRVICALSGGVDSAVVAALAHRALGDQLTCIFVDNGLLRRGEPQRVVETFEKHLGMRLVHVDAVDSFLGRLAGVDRPRGEAAHRRRRVHPHLRPGSAQARAHRLPGPGHALPGRDREHQPRHGQRGEPHQDAPQRRPAREPAVSS